MARRSTRIGIDLGGTKTEGIVIDNQGSILARKRLRTPAQEGYDAILESISSLVKDLETETGAEATIGIGTPGALSSRTGLLKNSNTVCLNGKPLRTDLENKLKRSVRLANDANCFALSEAIDGAGKDYNTVFGVIMGTGVGGGIVFDKKVHNGPHHIAGEWGHNILERDGPHCYCGKNGCVETFLSGPGLMRDYQQHGGRKETDTRTIAMLAANGDSLAEQSMLRYLAHFGKALSVIINILDPDVIVLGGGMSNINRLYSEGRQAVAEHVFSPTFRTPIVQNSHGDSAGVRGAAWLWPW
ncbi:MAG: ROK family protein [Acidiferrobacterales bacterium]